MKHPLAEGEIDIIAKLMATFEHPGSPTLKEEFRGRIQELTTVSGDCADFLFEHMLAIDPTTRVSLHFHHKEFVMKLLEDFYKDKEF